MKNQREIQPTESGEFWLKADLHVHSGEDPYDEVEYSAFDLIRRAHSMGFDAIAITLHDHVLTREELFESAQQLGIRLIPAAEMRLEGADVVILNISEPEALALRKLEDLRQLRAERNGDILIYAPHPYYVIGGSIGGARLQKYIDCFDAVEYCHFHTFGVNFNSRAVRLAQKFKKPLLATSDAHRLDFFGDHYSLIRTSANPSISEIFDSIRNGDLQLVSPAWPLKKFLDYLFYISVTHRAQTLLQKL